MEPSKKQLLKDLVFALQLGFEVIGIFLFAVILGLKLDDYLNTRPIILLFLLFLAFGWVIKLLLGVGKHD